jgi:F0F1-type ATP synthase alpha subunit
VFDDVSFHIKQLIWRGKRLLEQVKQGATTAINIEAQLVLITLSTAGFFDKFSIEETKNFKFDIVKSLRNSPNLVNIDVHKNLKVFEWSEKLLKAFSKLS